MKKNLVIVVGIIIFVLGYLVYYPDRCEQVLGDENFICEMGW